MNKLFVTGWLLVLSFFTVGCEEAEPDIIWSNNTGLDYFEARGFNLRLKEIRTFQEDIVNDETVYDVIRDVTLNIADILTVNDKDVITIGDLKSHPWTPIGYPYPRWQTFNPVWVNCQRIAMNMGVNGSTVYVNNPDAHHYKGTLTFNTEIWENGKYTGNEYDQSRQGYWESERLAWFEFQMFEGILILKAPARYTIGVWEGDVNPSVPLPASAVEDIVNNGVEGVDWSLFTRDGYTYVRILNNLYERRYDSWIYAGIADSYLTTTWIRNQTWIVFEVLDWYDITAPYEYGYYKGGAFYYIERRDCCFDFGSMYDYDIITTPTFWCF